MKKVYVLTKGCYSDYSIVGIFSTKEKLEEYKKYIPNNDYNDIEEYEINPNKPSLIKRGYSYWQVFMLKDGHVEKVSRIDNYYKDNNSYVWKRSKAPAYANTNTPDVLVSGCWARNEKHAIKITNEKRALYIASNQL